MGKSRGAATGQRKRAGYHHGDARAALLHAASMLLEQEGAHGLSLRAVAAEAGLSRQAPYNHFADKQALLAELVAGGFARLRERMLAVHGYPGGAETLADAAEAYIGFAQEAPALFRLMFSCELVDLSRFPDTQRMADAAYDSLRVIVAELAPAARVEELALAAWCLVHGYATLCLEMGLDDAALRAARARLFARLVRGDVDRPAVG